MEPTASSPSTDAAPSPPASERVLLIISPDPRQSHRANEAMRIGLGIVSGENDVTFVLTGSGTHLLDADTDSLVDGDDVARFRASLKSLGIPFHVEAESRPSDADWNADGHPVILVSGADLVALVRDSRRVLVF